MIAAPKSTHRPAVILRPVRILLAVMLLAALSLSYSRFGGRAPQVASAPGAAPLRAVSSSRTPVLSQASRSRWQHVIIVVEENHSYGEIIGNPSAPYLNHLAATGASFSRFYAVSHPSEPNYLALFSGSTHGVTDDSCPHTFWRGNLGAQLRASGHTFVGYSEALPYAGYTGCSSGSYARRHNPWVDFANLPPWVNQPLRAMPTDVARLPSLAFVIPNLQHDMHDGSVRSGDDWLKAHFNRYVTWSAAHHSLFVVVWDEDDRSASNHIAAIAVGAGVWRGVRGRWSTLYSLLRTIEDGFGLGHLYAAAHASGLRALGS